MVRGDLRWGLAQLAQEAPSGATLVIFHTAVLAYVPSLTDRLNFAREARSFCHYWISKVVFVKFSNLVMVPGDRVVNLLCQSRP